MQPVNYALDVPAPSQAFTEGLQTGSGIRGLQVQDQAQQAALAQQKLSVQLAAQQRADLAALAANPTPTAKDYAAIVFKYPALKDSMKQGWDALSAESQQARLNTLSPVFSAFTTGRVDIAKSLLQKEYDALKNSGGDPKEIAALDAIIKTTDAHPETAQKMIGLRLAGALGADKFESMFGKIGSEARADAELPSVIEARKAETGAKVAATAETVAKTAALPITTAAMVADIRSKIQTRAAQLDLDADKLETEAKLKIAELEQKSGKLEPDARKIINDSSVAAVLARNTAAQTRGLAGQFERADIAAGLKGTLGEKLAELTGQQDYVTQLRREYARVVNSEVAKALPPGAASDRDIALAREGFLKENASPTEIASFLRGVAKMQDYQAKIEDARGEWVAAVGHSGKAGKDIEIGGVKVPAGYTLSEFLKRTMASPGAATQAPKPGGKTDYLNKYGGASGSF